MMVVTQDKVTAVDLNQVVMVKSTKETKQKGVLSSSDLSFQEERTENVRSVRWTLTFVRRGGRVVYGTGLENQRCGVNQFSPLG